MFHSIKKKTFVLFKLNHCYQSNKESRWHEIVMNFFTVFWNGNKIIKNNHSYKEIFFTFLSLLNIWIFCVVWERYSMLQKESGEMFFSELRVIFMKVKTIQWNLELFNRVVDWYFHHFMLLILNLQIVCFSGLLKE